MREASQPRKATNLYFRDPRWKWIVASLSLLSCSLYGLLGAPAHEGGARPKPWQLSWWTQASEVHGGLRQPAVFADLNEVAVDPATNDVWIVGDGGAVVLIEEGKGPLEPIEIRLSDEDLLAYRQQLADLGETDLIPALEGLVETDSAPPPPPGQAGSEEPELDPKQSLPSDSFDVTSMPLPPDGKRVVRADLFAVSAPGNGGVWISSQVGLILHSSDRGATWAVQRSGTTEDLQDIVVHLDSTGLVYGQDSNLDPAAYLVGGSWASAAPDEAPIADLFAGSPVTLKMKENAPGFFIGEWAELLATAITSEELAISLVRDFDTVQLRLLKQPGSVTKRNGALGDPLPSELQFEFPDNWDIEFTSEEHGWVMVSETLAGSALLQTSDSGATWDTTLSTDVALTDMVVGPDGKLWAVGDRGAIYALGEGELLPLSTGAQVQAWPLSIHRSGAEPDPAGTERSNFGWFLSGSDLATRDQDGRWSTELLHAEGMQRPLVLSLDPVSAGVLLDSSERLWMRPSASNDWEPIPDPDSWDFSDFVALWIGDGAVVLIREDRVDVFEGGAWISGTVPENFGATPGCGHVVRPDGRALVGDYYSGRLFESDDFGRTWQAHGTSLTLDSISTVTMNDPARVWVADNESPAVLHKLDGTVKVPLPTSWSDMTMVSVASVSDSDIWVTNQGRMYATADAGQTWTELYPVPGGSGGVIEIARTDADRGWAAAGSRLFETTNGGETWAEVTLFERGPAPIYPLFFVLSLLVATPAFRRPEVQGARESVADILVSDRPLEEGEPDALDFDPIAENLARFLANPATEPPLTVAITGEWGSGKSSMMNLLKSKVERLGDFQVVWFNAWHHEKEEHLLAALLDSVRREGVPSIFQPRGFAFRGRLIWRRTVDRWKELLGSTAAAGVIGAGVANVFSALPDSFQNNFAWVPGLLDSLSEGTGVPLGPVTTSAGLALLTAFVRGLRAFESAPASLLAGEIGAKSSELQSQLSFRARFQREFRQVTKALGDRRLMVLIDDLDRCKPQHVSDVLEAVNFLSTCGELYVVLGMAEDRVLRSVGKSFQSVADEDYRKFLKEGVDADEARDLARLDFARHYMEKLINIRVPVPIPDPEAAAKVFDPRNLEELREKARAQRKHRIRQELVRDIPTLVVLSLLAWVGFHSTGITDGAPGVVALSPPSPPAGSKNPTDTGNPGSTGDSTVIEPDVPAAVEPLIGVPMTVVSQAHETRMPLGLTVAPLTIVTMLAVWALARTANRRPRDSSEFVEALQEWTSLVLARNPTPRLVKRFANRARFRAMAAPREKPTSSLNRWWQSVSRHWKKPNEAKKPPKGAELSEDVIVAFCALETFDRNIVRSDSDWLEFYGDLPLWLEDEPPEKVTNPREALHAFFGDPEKDRDHWEPKLTGDARAKFLASEGRVRIDTVPETLQDDDFSGSPVTFAAPSGSISVGAPPVDVKGEAPPKA